MKKSRNPFLLFRDNLKGKKKAKKGRRNQEVTSIKEK